MVMMDSIKDGLPLRVLYVAIIVRIIYIASNVMNGFARNALVKMVQALYFAALRALIYGLT